MKRIIEYLTILILPVSCSIQHNAVASLCGTFDDVSIGKHEIPSHTTLQLNPDCSFSLKHIVDLALIKCRGEWSLMDDGVIELTCSNDYGEDALSRALAAGSYIEGTVYVKVLSKHKLKIDNTVFKNMVLRKKKRGRRKYHEECCRTLKSLLY